MPYPQVVKIFATYQVPDYDSPWQAQSPSSGTGSGVIIGDNQILTGAHVIANATFIQLQKPSDPDKVVASVKAVCHDCDLALLETEDTGFTRGIPYAKIGELAVQRDNVAVVGFPIGGEEVSITEGVVSRVEVQRYDHSQRKLLAVTVDAAINEGNSGGPVFREGMVVGIAFQKLQNADNVGEIVPAPIIRHFLEGVGRDNYKHVPGFGLSTQNMENPLLRRYVGLQPHQSGVLVISVEHGGSAWGVLGPGDALLAIEGHPIANNGTIQYRDKYRTRYHAILGDYFVGDVIAMTVLHQGQEGQVHVELKPPTYLVPRAQYDLLPTYFVYGGLVFQRLTRDYLATWDDWWEKAPAELLNYYFAGVRSEQRQEVIVLSQVLADDINVGYGHLYQEAVIAVNGAMPRTMDDLVERIEASSGVVEFKTSRQGVIMLDTDAVQEATPRILERYRITRDRSPDLPGTPNVLEILE